MSAPQLALFDGRTFDPAYDQDRLAHLLGRVWQRMRYGGWFTLKELTQHCGGSEAGCSARIRDLRKPKFGGYVVERRRRGDPKNGLWEYRLSR